MTLDTVRRRWESARRALEEQSRAMKDPYVTLDGLRAMYGRLGGEERRQADRVLSEWLLATDENIRFDALVLVDEFKIVAAVSSLDELGARLAVDPSPGAPFELEKVRRIRGNLGPPAS